MYNFNFYSIYYINKKDKQIKQDHSFIKIIGLSKSIVVARSGFSTNATEAKSSYTLKTTRNSLSWKFIGSNSYNRPKVAPKSEEGGILEDIVNTYEIKKLNKVTLRTATKRLTCFSRRGNHPRRNTMFSNYRRTRAMQTKQNKKLPLSFYLPTFFHAATPFVRLKTRRQRSRRRRKKLFQKVSYRLRENGERQSYLLFSKRLQKTKKSTKTGLFREQIQSQREVLFVPKTRRKTNERKLDSIKGIKSKGKFSTQSSLSAITTIASPSTNTVKNLRQIRDEIHKRAYRIKPRRWRFKKKVFAVSSVKNSIKYSKNIARFLQKKGKVKFVWGKSALRNKRRRKELTKQWKKEVITPRRVIPISSEHLGRLANVGTRSIKETPSNKKKNISSNKITQINTTKNTKLILSRLIQKIKKSKSV